MNENELI